MRLHQILTACAMFATLCCAGQSGSIHRLDRSSLSFGEADAFARKTLQDAHVTGAQIAILEHGRLTWSAAFGLRQHDPSLPMDHDTTTWAASITKPVFATYFMQLVEQGKVALGVPVARQLAKPLDQYAGYEEQASLLVKDPEWARVTPRMLLSHSSGLQNFAAQEPDKKLHLHYPPGTHYLYSGTGINIVQLLVEQKLGRPIEQLMQEAFFDPLKMTRTGMIYRKDFAEDVADRFDMNNKFHAKTQRFPARAAGSMTTSAEDLARFITALFAGTLISRNSLDEMLAPVLPIRTLHEFPLTLDEAKLDAPESAETRQVGLAYGIGWGLLTSTKYGPAFFKEGHGDGAQNYVACFTRSETCMVVLTNSDNGELSFRPLFEKLIGDTVTPWEWEGYTPAYIEAARKNQ